MSLIPSLPETIRPIVVFEGTGRIDLATLLIQRARASKSTAAQMIKALRESGKTIQQVSKIAGHDWRQLWNIVHTGLYLPLDRREMKGFFDIVDLATAMNREFSVDIQGAAAAGRMAHLKRKLGLTPYKYEWSGLGRVSLFAGMRAEHHGWPLAVRRQ